MSERCKSKRPKQNKSARQSAKQLSDEMRSWPDKTDVLGSYTGMGEGSEKPVQDADDL